MAELKTSDLSQVVSVATTDLIAFSQDQGGSYASKYVEFHDLTDSIPSPKKWTADYSGLAPTLDTTDGVKIGDLAIDSNVASSTYIWRNQDDTDSAPLWIREDVSPSNTIYVAKNGSDDTGDGSVVKPYLTIKYAFSALTSPGPTNRYAIWVAPGIYDEDNPVQVTQYTSLRALGDLQTTRIVAANPNQDLLIMANLFTMAGFSLWGVSGATNYAINQSTVTSTSISRCLIGQCTNGALVNSTGAKLVMNDVACFNPTVPLIKGCCCLAGEMNAYIFYSSAGSMETLLEWSGVTAFGIAENVNTYVGTLGYPVTPYGLDTALEVKDGAKVNINGAKLASNVASIHASNSAQVTITDTKIAGISGTNIPIGIHIEGDGTHVDISSTSIAYADFGLHCDDNSETHSAAVFIRSCDKGVYMNSTGSPYLEMAGSAIRDSVTLDVDLQNENATFLFQGVVNEDKLYLDGARFVMAHLQNNEGDDGFAVKGELHVGSPEQPSESVLGEGDSYTRGMLVYAANAAGYFTDVSAEAASLSGSTFTYPSTDANDAIYIASDLIRDGALIEHYGIKAAVNVAADITGGSIIAEYWDGATWSEVNTMSTDAGGSFYPHNGEIFERAGSEQVRYDITLAADSWTANDPIVPATGTNRYWARFRIETGITTAPIFDQFKIHSSRFEVNQDGYLEYFGTGRPSRLLPWNVTMVKDTGTIMGSEELWMGQNIGIGFEDNLFNTNTDYVAFTSPLPLDIDTSSPIKFAWSTRPDGGITSDWTIRWGYSTEGDAIELLNPGAPVAKQFSTTLTKAHTTDVLNWFTVNLDVSDMVARREGGFGDTIWVSLQCTTATANSQALIGIAGEYFAWCAGGHI